MPTIFDVAEAAGVSIASVSLVLKDPDTPRVGQARRQEIIRIANRLGYKPNMLAKGLKSQGTGIIGMVVPMRDAIFFNPFITEFLSGIQTHLVEKHYHLLIYSHDSQRGKITHSELIQSKAADGMIVINTRLSTKADIQATIKELDAARVPFAMINSYCGGKINYVGMDYEQIGYDVGEYLCQHGHRKIAFLGGAQGSPASPPMLAGFKRALAAQRVTLQERFIAFSEYESEAVRKLTRRWLKLKDRPTAIYCTSDQLVPDIYAVAKEEKLTIPRDLAVVGRGDVNFAALLNPTLTTVRLPLFEIGRRAAELLVNNLNQPNAQTQKILLPSQLIARESA
ncbi:MAG: LacI family DNA-binding transcriptional regulator [Acidobacteria bacterium]|nr:LacI family DNA-binding transcriptional regulator [Acidobacteriota bacterium]